MTYRFLDILRYIFITLVGICSLADAQAQGIDIAFERLSVQEGLSQATAYAVYEDQLGFIWIGTDDGLDRYDGYGFEKFKNDPLNATSLSNNSVNSIIEDDQGQLWIGTDKGLNRMNAESKRFERFTFDLYDDRSLSSNTVWCMERDARGELWIGTANGLNRFRDQDTSFTQFKQDVNDLKSLSSNSINALHTDSKGNLWIGTNQGLNRWDERLQRFEHYPIPGDERRYGQAVQCINEDVDGTLLVGTNQGLFELADGTLKQSTKLSIGDKRINSIRADSQGDLWIGSERGLFQFLKGKRRPIIHRALSDSKSISDDDINSIIEDSTGIIWIGTANGGVNLFYREQQQIFHFDQREMGRRAMPSDVVNGMEEVRPGQFWLATDGGIGILTDASMDPADKLNVPNSIIGTSTRVIVKNRELIAIGTSSDGVYIMEIGSDVVRHFVQTSTGDGLSDDRINDLAFSGDRLIVATQNGGINIVDLMTDEIQQIKYVASDKTGIRDNRITSVALENDNIWWLGTATSGVQRYDSRTGSFTSYNIKSDTLRKLSNDKILSLHFDYGFVWIGTRGGGLNKLDPSTGLITIYTTEQGLANNVVTDVLSDDRGRVWMSTNKGVSVMDIESSNFTNYGEREGLGNQRFTPGGGKRTSGGAVLFGGQQGVDIIRYADIAQNSVLPTVYFTQVEAFDAKENMYDPELSRSLVHKLEEIDLPPNISLVTLGFVGINYRRPEKNRYAYRLAGITDEWTYVNDRRYVTFSELPPGSYALEVKAANNDGKWSENPTALVLNIEAAYYQTRWFQGLFLLAIGFGVYTLLRYRTRSVTRRNKLLEERVRVRTRQISKERDEKAILLKEIHHRVKNNLQIIISLLRLQSHYVNDKEALWALDESQNRVMSMAMIHERMYKTDNLADINTRNYIGDLCKDIVATYDLNNNVKLDLDIQVERLNLDTLTPLGLVINEVASNAMKYAFPDDRSGTFTVHLTAIQPGKKYHLLIGDDGVGMPFDLTDTEQDSLGTILIESLSEQLNGVLTRRDGPGTLYELNFEQLEDEVKNR